MSNPYVFFFVLPADPGHVSERAWQPLWAKTSNMALHWL